jgi:hypothetical protein
MDMCFWDSCEHGDNGIRTDRDSTGLAVAAERIDSVRNTGALSLAMPDMCQWPSRGEIGGDRSMTAGKGQNSLDMK